MGADRGEVCVPPEAFPRLILGYRCVEELRDAWPDTWVKPEYACLADTLFPRITSHFYVPYLYNGPLPPTPAW